MKIPLLVLNQASLDDFNADLEGPVAMARFRPNVVLAGGGAGSEQSWRQLKIGDLDLTYLAACERCELPNVNPATGSADREVIVRRGNELPLQVRGGVTRPDTSVMRELEEFEISFCRVGDVVMLHPPRLVPTVLIHRQCHRARGDRGEHSWPDGLL